MNMKTQYELNNQNFSVLNTNRGLVLLWGILLLILGLLAIGASAFTTIVTVIFLGILLLISGIFIIVDAFKFWWQRWAGFLLHFLTGILYVVVGLMLINNPIFGSVSITLLLGCFYVVIGLFRLVYSSSLRVNSWEWSFFSGLISLLLGIFILINWPAASLFILGLFVGIDLLFAGWTYVMMALSARP